MKVKPKQNIPQVRIENAAAEGKCIARVDNKVIFVERAAPGDLVDLRITKKKKSFLEGKITAIHEPSPDRVTPFCQHYDFCGGCKWQHMHYDGQLAQKTQQVVDSLERIGKVAYPSINPIIPSGNTTYYRNKLEFTFSDKRWFTREEIDQGGDLTQAGLGFHMPGRFDRIVDIKHCYLQSGPSNAIRLAIKEYALAHNIPFYNLRNHTGTLRNLIIRTSNVGHVMVIVQFAGQHVDDLKGLLSHLVDQFKTITSLNYVINNKKNETFNDLEVVTFHGQAFIEESMPLPQEDGALTYRIGPKSFYQTNSGQAFYLYKAAFDMAGFTGNEIVYDLYTGTGTIANFIARSVQKVVGLEYVEEATQDAEANAQLNNIHNTEFLPGDIKELLTPELVAQHGQPDVVITDPPRAGMHKDVVAQILAIAAKRVIYISCNPATQARDLAMLAEKYDITHVQPVDMFPQTYHVENIVRLDLKV